MAVLLTVAEEATAALPVATEPDTESHLRVAFLFPAGKVPFLYHRRATMSAGRRFWMTGASPPRSERPSSRPPVRQPGPLPHRPAKAGLTP